MEIEARKRVTQRQLEMLALHAQGLTKAEIGREMYLSPATVRNDLAELSEILGALNLYHTQMLAYAEGLICIDGRTKRPFVPRRTIETETGKLVAAA